MDTLNALSITAYAIDAKYRTSYNRRPLACLEYVQENDLVCTGAMTDPKDDRSPAPSKQPDHY
jgi:4-hydroxybutyryl-CoA dehydratase/vinylacetyl-CoA-Delta-isomerase